MDGDIKRVQSELASLGYESSTRPSSLGSVVEFDYIVETGSNQGTTFRIGLSFQEAGYPEYPPHWIHVSPPVDDGRLNVRRYKTEDGRQWAAMSRPPSDIWDKLPVKDARNYLNEHLRRFWSGL